MRSPPHAEGVSPRAQAILATLDDAQREAALAGPGPIVVVGGAGTGKSRVMAHRMAYLCAARGVSPRKILALTASESGAEALKMRAERLLGLPLFGAWLGTLQAVCQRILRAHAAALGRKASFTILDEVDARTLIRSAAKTVGADPERWPPGRLQAAIAARKTGQAGASDPVVDEVYHAYERALAAVNAFDADDVLHHVLGLLEGGPALRDKYRRRFEHILVDDLQDATAQKRRLLALLGGPDGNVAAFTDEGGLGDDFPGAQVFRLVHNYRSSKRIVHVANRIRRRLGEDDLVPTRKRGARVLELAVGDEREEADLVVAYLGRLRRRQPGLRAAVMYRQARQARLFEEALTRARVAYRVVGGQRFHERREVRDLIAYLRLAVGGGDHEALSRIANVPRRGIGPASVATIARLQRTSRATMAEAALTAASLPRVTAQRAGALADLGRMLEDLAEAARRMSCADLIDYIVERTGYGGHLAELSGSEEESRREGIDELRAMAREYPGPAGEALPRLLEQAAAAGVPLADPRHEGVQLLTFSAAKEVEVDCLFMTGLEEELVPSANGSLDAERRLFYVALARARDRLVFTHALTRSVLGQPRGRRPSRFLAEAGRRVRRFTLGGARRGPAPAAGVEASPGLRVVAIGQKVAHPRYGPGVVTTVEEGGGGTMVTVRFEDGAEKRLALAVARLEAL